MRTLRAAGAGLLLVLLVAGVPLALAATVGNPLGSWPDLLAGDVTDRVIIDILAAAGVRELWLVYPIGKRIERFYFDRQDDLPSETFGINDVFTCSFFPGLRFDVGQIFSKITTSDRQG